MLKRVLPMFSSRIFMVSSFTFRSLIRFEFIFAYGMRKCSNFILLHVAVQSPKTNQEEIEDINTLITSDDIELVMKINNNNSRQTKV